KYAVNTLGVVWQVHLLADALRHLPDEPDSLRLQLLVRREVAFDKDLECVADNLRIFMAERADALLQLGERVKIIVQPAPYQQSRVRVFRWHRVQLFSRLLTSNEPVHDSLPARHLFRPSRPRASGRSRASACGPRGGQKPVFTSKAHPCTKTDCVPLEPPPKLKNCSIDSQEFEERVEDPLQHFQRANPALCGGLQ